MFFLIALLVGVIGAAPIFVSRMENSEKVGFFFGLAIFFTLIGWWIFYGALPSAAYPLFGWYGGVLVIWWVVTAVVAFIGEDNWSHAGWFPIVGLLVVLSTSMSGCEMLNWQKYANLIGSIDNKTEQHWSQEIQPLDPTRIRLVPDSLAIALAKTALSQNGNTLGSQFPLATDYITLQKIRNDYWYLIPLDFKGYRVWTQAQFVPGYVKISATDPYAKPILVTGKRMIYTPGAWFGNNLQRILRRKYWDKILMDYSFEEDDSGNVYWVVTVAHPTISYYGPKVDGVVIFDPQTGDQTFVSQRDIDKDPQYRWVDRVMPASIVKKYVDYWGDLKGGWGNSFWTHVNLLEGETPTMNYSADGRCVFVTPVTSSSKQDEAMTGLMYTDARTGKTTYYTTSGGATEGAIIQAVNSVIGYKHWEASSQIVYENVFGKLAALVPILGQSGNYQGLALVENANKRVAIGTSPEEALVEFQKILMSNGGQITTSSIRNLVSYTGKVARIGWDMSTSGKEYYVYFSGMRHSFILSSDVQSELPLTQVGDEVSIKYINSGEASMPVMYFKNETLGLQSSSGQISVDQQMERRQEAVQKTSDVSDFKASLKNMSDQELQKLMKLEKEQKKHK